jgi:hypothetical protein
MEHRENSVTPSQCVGSKWQEGSRRLAAAISDYWTATEAVGGGRTREWAECGALLSSLLTSYRVCTEAAAAQCRRRARWGQCAVELSSLFASYRGSLAKRLAAEADVDAAY